MATTIRETLKQKGWVLIPNAVAPDLVERCRADLDKSYRVCRELQVRNGVGMNTDGTVHHVVGLGAGFLQLLEDLPMWDLVTQYFGGKFILNSFGGVFNFPGSSTYVGKVHRDVRSFTGSLPLMLNVLVMLDEFTLENGATYLLEGSHLKGDRPSDDAFFKNAARAVGAVGTVLLFDSNLWHAAGSNSTKHQRRALTLTFTPPYLKQQCDYCRALGAERVEAMSPHLKQLLGYYSRTPSSLDEWYQPVDKRLYRSDQG